MAEGFLDERQKKTRSISNKINFYWLQNKRKNEEFTFKWIPEDKVISDYVPKHHLA